MVAEYLKYHMIALMIGYVLDLIIGDPHGIPHPVVAIGKLISCLEKALLKKRSDQKKEFLSGLLLCVTVIITTVMLTTMVTVGAYLIHPYLGMAVEAILICYLLAARCLQKESMKIYKDVAENDIDKARKDLSMIVGRDTDKLDYKGILKAAVETVAENTSDGVIAPLIYASIAGALLGLAYKAVNTMDSMVGYHNERYEYFGKCAAILDDIVNFIPSRLSALFIIASSFILRLSDKAYSPLMAFKIWKRDRLNHKSPNSAQTESAVSGCLGLKLGGPSFYGGVLSDKPYIGDEIKEIEKEDIVRACRLMFISQAMVLIIAEIILYIIYVNMLC
ncbi:MAG: cobalamin biosynthesis protein CobD [Lachnospiraceae bacterium]|nr:cobalamin biosynthesis protein CobD [Lachnospiraceae bacterium]